MDRSHYCNLTPGTVFIITYTCYVTLMGVDQSNPFYWQQPRIASQTLLCGEVYTTISVDVKKRHEDKQIYDVILCLLSQNNTLVNFFIDLQFFKDEDGFHTQYYKRLVIP